MKTDNVSDMEGAFLCGSMIEIMPISRIQNRLMSTSELPLFQKQNGVLAFG